MTETVAVTWASMTPVFPELLLIGVAVTLIGLDLFAPRQRQLLPWLTVIGCLATLGMVLGMVPVSALAYEVIKLAGKFHTNIVCRLISAPGLFMQMLTTKEPDDAQIEVALAALDGAVAGRPTA